MIEKIIEEVKNVLNKYSCDNIDVIFEDDDRTTLCIMYHSRHNSFPASDKSFPAEGVNLEKLEKELDYLDVGYVW